MGLFGKRRGTGKGKASSKKEHPSARNLTRVLKSPELIAREIETSLRAAEKHIDGRNFVALRTHLSSLDYHTASRVVRTFAENLGENTESFAQRLGSDSGEFARALGVYSKPFIEGLGPRVQNFSAGLGIHLYDFASGLHLDLEVFAEGLGSNSRVFAEGLGLYARHFARGLGELTYLFARGLGRNKTSFVKGLIKTGQFDNFLNDLSKSQREKFSE